MLSRAEGLNVLCFDTCCNETLLAIQCSYLKMLVNACDKTVLYVVRSSSGFAPNPFWGCCTLACCKLQIRLAAKAGDWVIGTGSKSNVGQNKLIYAMKITEKLSFDVIMKIHGSAVRSHHVD